MYPKKMSTVRWVDLGGSRRGVFGSFLSLLCSGSTWSWGGGAI